MTWKTAVDTGVVAGLCHHDGPFLSAYIDVSRDSEDAQYQLELRWRGAAEALRDSGASEKLVDLAGQRLMADPAGGGAMARMVVAADEAILLDDVVRRPRSAEVVSFGALPDVTAWLRDRAMMRAVLVVMADREGADLEMHEAWPDEAVDEDTVHGGTEHITKVHGGGYAHKQYQRRAEMRWRRNAEEVASEIEERVGGGVRLIALTGDVRARKEVKDVLSDAARDLVVEVDASGRQAGDSREALDEAIDEVVREVVMTDHLRVVRELEEEVGRAGAGVQGRGEVLPALLRGQVDTLLLAPERAARHEVDPREYPGLALPASAAEAVRLRADLAAVCAAAGTGADVVMVSRPLIDDGIAALLRWREDAAQPD